MVDKSRLVVFGVRHLACWELRVCVPEGAKLSMSRQDVGERCLISATDICYVLDTFPTAVPESRRSTSPAMERGLKPFFAKYIVVPGMYSLVLLSLFLLLQ